MKTTEPVLALRSSAAVSRLDHVRCRRVRGPEAYEAMDAVVPAELRIRDGQVLHSLLLDDEAHPFADLLLAVDGDELLLLAEGPEPAALDDYLRRHVDGREVEIEDVSATHTVIGLDGPYAWELLSLIAGPEAYGLPYLTFFHAPPGLCLRAGKTGEYGYLVIVPRDEAETLVADLLERGASLDVVRADQVALDVCALENWYFNIRREGREAVTPIELQLQWRVSRRKPFVGAEAQARRRREGARERLTCLVSQAPLEAPSEVQLEGERVGRLVNAGFSPTRQDWIGLALLDVACAYPGIDGFSVRGRAAEAAARSVSPPLLNNRSLHVSPQIHSYRSRDEFSFPPLPRG